jgi:hypothetical protein
LWNEASSFDPFLLIKIVLLCLCHPVVETEPLLKLIPLGNFWQSAGFFVCFLVLSSLHERCAWAFLSSTGFLLGILFSSGICFCFLDFESLAVQKSSSGCFDLFPLLRPIVWLVDGLEKNISYWNFHPWLDMMIWAYFVNSRTQHLCLTAIFC